jgi:hypothetical protein
MHVNCQMRMINPSLTFGGIATLSEIHPLRVRKDRTDFVYLFTSLTSRITSFLIIFLLLDGSIFVVPHLIIKLLSSSTQLDPTLGEYPHGKSITRKHTSYSVLHFCYYFLKHACSDMIHIFHLTT